MTPERQAQLRKMVHRHLVACAEEGKRDFRDAAETPSAAGLAAIYEMLRQTAYSFGCTLASANVPRGDLIDGAMKELRAEFELGYSRPGEGVMI